MAASPHAQLPSRREDAFAIVRRLVDARHVAYFAGGCVRDALLGLDPKDYDVATSARPDEVRRLFPRSQGVGQAFGVVLVREGKSVIEVATFRADGIYSDGRRPDEVHFAGPEEDARRRDFTINGVFYDPVADRVIDLVDGRADLEKRVLRAIGDPAHRFAEDYLRLLRAIRFAARFDLAIDAATEAAIRVNAERLPQIAPERIADELRSMLGAPSRLRAARLLGELGLTPIILRRVVSGVPATTSSPLLNAVLRGATPPSFPFALVAWTIDASLAAGRSFDAIIARDSASEATRALRQTFRLSNDDSAALDTLFGIEQLLRSDVPTVAVLKRFLATDHAAEAMRLLDVLAASGVHTDRIKDVRSVIATFEADSIAPLPFVTGNDLTEAGYAPGPAFKHALDDAYDAQLEDRAKTKAEAFAIARAIVERSRSSSH